MFFTFSVFFTAVLLLNFKVIIRAVIVQDLIVSFAEKVAVLFLFSGVKTVMFFLCTVECYSIIKSVFCIRLKVIIRKSANQMKVWDAKLQGL